MSQIQERNRRSSSVKYLLEENGSITFAEKPKAKWSILSLLPSPTTCIAVAGIYGFFIPFGYFQEKIYAYRSANEKFDFPICFTLSLLSFNSFTSWLLLYIKHCGIKLKVPKFLREKPEDYEEIGKENISENKDPDNVVEPKFHFFEKHVSKLNYSVLREIYFVALTYSISIISTSFAMNHVSYPTQVLCKSAKTIPVILGGRLIYKRRYPYFDYMTVLIVSVTLVIFNLQQKSSNTRGNGLLGLFLLGISLLCDSMTGPRQDKINTTCQFSAIHMMFLTNSAGVLLTLSLALIVEAPYECVKFLSSHPDVALYICSAGVLHSLGQCFIFWTLTTKGSLQLALITTLRKCFSVVVSVIMYKNPISTVQWFCVGILFGTLALQTVLKEMNKNNKNVLKF